jgi:hypothetical protein
VRQRPDIELRTAANIDDATMVETVIQEARSAEVMLSVLDRRSFKGLRLGASVINIFGLGEQNLRRSNARVVRLSASRDYKGGRGVLDVDLSYLTSEDESRDDNCVGAPDVLSCFGTASTSTLALSGTTFYRLKEDWMVVGSASAGTQTLENTLGVETATQPANLLLSAFVRLAYRF